MAPVPQSSPLLKLPVELIDNIAAHLENDTRALSSYSLISKPFLDIARRRLLQSLDLTVSYEQPGDTDVSVSKRSSESDASNSCSSNAVYLGDFLTFILDNPSTAKYIHDLKIRSHPDSIYTLKKADITLRQLDLIMTTCTSLRALSLKGMHLRIDPRNDAPDAATISTPRPTPMWSIKTLNLSHIVAQTEEAPGYSSVFYILSLFKKIDSLTLALPPVWGSGAVPEVVEDALPKNLEIRSLTLSGRVSEPSLYHAFTRTTLASSLRELRLSKTFDDSHLLLVEEALIPSCSALETFELDMRHTFLFLDDALDLDFIADFVMPSCVAQLSVTALLLRFRSSESLLAPSIHILQGIVKSLPATLETIYVELLVVGGQDHRDLERIRGMDWNAMRQTFNSLAHLRRVHFNFVATSLSDPLLLDSASDSVPALPPTAAHRAAIRDAVMGGLSPLRDNISLGHRYTIDPADRSALAIADLKELED